MKRITTLVLVALIGFALPSQAQLKFGLKGGIDVYEMSFDEEFLNYANSSGWFIGTSVKFTLPIVGLGFDLSALYEEKTTDIGSYTDDIAYTTLKQQSVNIPINLRYIVGLSRLASIYVAIGPQFSCYVGERGQEIYDDTANWTLRSSNLSFNVGAGLFLLGHLQIGFNYNIPCGKTGEMEWDLDNAERVYNNRDKTWQVSAAYYF